MAPNGNVHFSIQLIGIEQVLKKLKDKVKRIKRVTELGINSVGHKLLWEKRLKCKMGLYSGQEVAPNKWRFGWEYLGGPAKYHFTRAIYYAHKLGEIQKSGNVHSIDIFIDTSMAPHAAVIHGDMDTVSTFYPPRLHMPVKTRPWMKATELEKNEAVKDIIFTYKI